MPEGCREGDACDKGTLLVIGCCKVESCISACTEACLDSEPLHLPVAESGVVNPTIAHSSLNMHVQAIVA